MLLKKDLETMRSYSLPIIMSAGVFSERGIKQLEMITEEARLLPQIIRVDSLTNYSLIDSLEDEIIIELFLPDGYLAADIPKLKDKRLIS